MSAGPHSVKKVGRRWLVFRGKMIVFDAGRSKRLVGYVADALNEAYAAGRANTLNEKGGG